MTNIGDLYDQDFFLWTQQQAAALRAVRKSNLPLDWDNIAEEIESLGKAQRSELGSQIRRILRHLFKLEASPATNPQAGWRATILDARVEIEELLEISPSLRREVEVVVRQQTTVAAKLAAADLEDFGEPADNIKARLDKGGFTAEEVLGDWLPGTPG
jgi:uncharacterized protein DUF29